MKDLMIRVSELRRPRLLIRAARFGVDDYNRARDLKRLTGQSQAPSPERAIATLLVAEQGMEDTRCEGSASYSVVRHVELLVALLAEVRLMPHRPVCL